MYFNNLGRLLSVVYPGLSWARKTVDKVIYLTFDDGPIPGVTDYVLEELDRYQAKATFFCVGDNVQKHPSVLQKVISRGHKVGNHTFNHLNGWKNDTEVYIENTRKCDEVLCSTIPGGEEQAYYSSASRKKLYRPPYGKIRKAQIRYLRDQYEIVMWDVLTGDFDKNLSPEKCLKKAIRYTRHGSIVIFHDSVKALPNLQYVLPRYMEHFTKAGYRFESL